jgi:hypothetical protein
MKKPVATQAQSIDTARSNLRPLVMPQYYSSLALALSSSLLATVGCAAILGIENAECDAEYSADCRPLLETGGNAGESPLPDAATESTGDAPAAGIEASNPSSSALDGAASTVAAASLCDRYCQTIAGNCVGGDQQYASPEACHAVCELLPPGEPGDVDVNSVECRLNRAELAVTTGEPANYCFSAGPGGAGICGADCEGFCSVMTAQCTQLGTWETCLSACAAVPNLSGPPDNLRFNTSLQSGDSVQCRLFHVSAASLDPVGHCVHAAGIAVCGGPS